MHGSVASVSIPVGEILEEYFGHIQHIRVPLKFNPVNEGYHLRLKTKASGNKHAGIDAFHGGGKLRPLNHSIMQFLCKIPRGEEVTVSYGDQLWLVCQCGWWGCQH
eukprot:jgi/Phyca11/111702/e_gw1.20.197.1